MSDSIRFSHVPLNGWVAEVHLAGGGSFWIAAYNGLPSALTFGSRGGALGEVKAMQGDAHGNGGATIVRDVAA